MTAVEKRAYFHVANGHWLKKNRVFMGVEGIGVVKLGQKDIVRHKLVTRIVNAYDKYDKERAEEKKTIKN